MTEVAVIIEVTIVVVVIDETVMEAEVEIEVDHHDEINAEMIDTTVAVEGIRYFIGGSTLD